MKAVILAAGMGSRLGKGLPKCLTKLPTGQTIIERQIDILKKHINEVYVIVGYKKELIMEANRNVFYVYNDLFIQNNTSKSLLYALNNFDADDVIWLNGDVVFDEEILGLIVKQDNNASAVQYDKVGEEEIKFRLDEEGYICELSKQVKNALGESVGINKVLKRDLDKFKELLSRCEEKDYFEKAIEFGYDQGIKFKPVDVTEYKCIEVDFIEDYNRVVELFNS